jgi:hypothetical protein
VFGYILGGFFCKLIWSPWRQANLVEGNDSALFFQKRQSSPFAEKGKKAALRF